MPDEEIIEKYFEQYLEKDCFLKDFIVRKLGISDPIPLRRIASRLVAEGLAKDMSTKDGPDALLNQKGVSIALSGGYHIYSDSLSEPRFFRKPDISFAGTEENGHYQASQKVGLPKSVSNLFAPVNTIIAIVASIVGIIGVAIVIWPEFARWIRSFFD